MVGVIRGVAQVARVLAWGARGRKFKSCHSDHCHKVTCLVAFYCIFIPILPEYVTFFFTYLLWYSGETMV